jgi:hypothetical protein
VTETVVTGQDGVAIVRLRVGPHRLTASKAWRGLLYNWDHQVRVTPGLQSVTLDSSNASKVVRAPSTERLSPVTISTRRAAPPAESVWPRQAEPVFFPRGKARDDRFVSGQSAIALFDLGLFGAGSLDLLNYHWSSPCTDASCATLPASIRTAIGALLMARVVPVGIVSSDSSP